MKRIISVLMTITLIALSFSFSAFGADLTDGTYQVPVTLMHKEDEKESFGARYIASVALLKVKAGKKTIIIFLTTDMNGIEFSYYTNGIINGEVAQATPVSNITVGGNSYEKGFELPIVADGDIGLKFSVPVMPMSPSARLRIDYDNAVLVFEKESAEETTQPVIEETITQISAESTTEKEETTKTETTTMTITETTSSVTETLTTTPATVSQISENSNEKNTSIVPYIVLFVMGTVALVFLVNKELDA